MRDRAAKALFFLVATVFSLGLFLLVYLGWRAWKYFRRLPAWGRWLAGVALCATVFGAFVVGGLLARTLAHRKREYGSFAKPHPGSVLGGAAKKPGVKKDEEGRVHYEVE